MEYDQRRWPTNGKIKRELKLRNNVNVLKVKKWNIKEQLEYEDVLYIW